jgi:hypothetical protein
MWSLNSGKLFSITVLGQAEKCLTAVYKLFKLLPNRMACDSGNLELT